LPKRVSVIVKELSRLGYIDCNAEVLLASIAALVTCSVSHFLSAAVEVKAKTEVTRRERAAWASSVKNTLEASEWLKIPLSSRVSAISSSLRIDSWGALIKDAKEVNPISESTDKARATRDSLERSIESERAAAKYISVVSLRSAALSRASTMSYCDNEEISSADVISSSQIPTVEQLRPVVESNSKNILELLDAALFMSSHSVRANSKVTT
jgi:hypothetical protein